MRKGLWLLLVLAFGCASSAAESPAGDRALAVVEQMMEAMGGETAWQQARFLRFDWAVERDGKQVAYVRHLWDRYDGRYRVEWTSREGRQLEAFFNVNTRTGRVFVNGEPARDEDEQKYLDQAYERFINDSYWLLMPWKLKDPGVTLEYAGEATLDGQKCDLVHVSFTSVGLTPGDHYWAYINRRTHLMDRWAYFLQDFEGRPALDKATAWAWRNWEMVGRIRLAREKVKVEGNARIHFPFLSSPRDVVDSVFESRGTPMPGPAPAAK
jgi:hypothetical protein